MFWKKKKVGKVEVVEKKKCTTHQPANKWSSQTLCGMVSGSIDGHHVWDCQYSHLDRNQVYDHTPCPTCDAVKEHRAYDKKEYEISKREIEKEHNAIVKALKDDVETYKTETFNAKEKAMDVMTKYDKVFDELTKYRERNNV